MTIPSFKSCRYLLAASMLAAFAMLGPAEVAAQQPTVAERLQRLEDKEAIQSILERYFEYQESGQTEAFANLFAKDGELILRRGATTGGPAGILRSMSRGANRSAADAAAPASPPATGAASAPSTGAARPSLEGMRHILSNVHIEVKGDTATASSRWTMLVPGEDNRTTRIGGSGRYVDKLVRENGEWKFQKRVIARDIPFDKEGANPPVD
jgi:hypothetical protein